MKFLDQVKIFIKAGDGGSGSPSFRREKFIEFGGPDGGDGGKGGSVILKSERNLNTLIDYRYQQHFKAKRGEDGKGQNKTGRGGEDLFLRVARAETEEEAVFGAKAIYQDLILIFLWGVRTNNIKLDVTGGSPNDMLKTYEDFISNDGLWWTDHPGHQPKKPFKFKKPQGCFTGLAVVVIGCAISPPIGGVFIGLFLLWCVLYQIGNTLSS